jgi:hypothetical protein
MSQTVCQLQSIPIVLEKFNFLLHIQELIMHLPKFILSLNYNLRNPLFSDMMPVTSFGAVGMTQ